MPLRDYQREMISRARKAFLRGAKRVCLQGPTGSGKTIIFTEITGSIFSTGKRIWIQAPRNELINQASNKLKDAGIPHGRIDAKHEESAAFRVHVVSKNTLLRRIEKGIVNPPDWLIPDECHIALDSQIKIWEKLNRPLMLGFTATPERTDGRGLSELYQELVMGPSLAYLVECGFLSEPEYYQPPLDGLDALATRGTEFVPSELEKFLEEKAVYGNALSHYENRAPGEPAIVFVRSVKEAAKTSRLWSQSGWKFENIDGSMTADQRLMLIDGLKDGRLHGLVSCDLLTYGVDIPNVSVISILRPTLSAALFFQMIGRGLRMFEGKGACKIFDHVNNLATHGHPLDPRDWAFDGVEKKRAKKADPELVARLCPNIDFLHCSKPTCAGCPHDDGTTRKQKMMRVVEAELVRANPRMKLQDRPPIQKAIYQHRISDAVHEYQQTGGCDPIGRLVKIAKELKFKPLWVYWKLSEGRHSVNVPLLHEIQKQMGCSKRWAWFQRKHISEKLAAKRRL